MVEISGSERLIYDTGERNGRAEVAIILNDLIAELRGIEMYADRMDPMLVMKEAIGHAETKLREVQGE